jgi:hypothetical protein
MNSDEITPAQLMASAPCLPPRPRISIPLSRARREYRSLLKRISTYDVEVTRCGKEVVALLVSPEHGAEIELAKAWIVKARPLCERMTPRTATGEVDRNL